MARRFRPYDQSQCLLLPPSLREWLPDDHLSILISDVLDELDLDDLIADYDTGDGRGAPPFHPRMLLKVMIFGYATGTFSSRKLAARCVDDVGFRYLAAQQRPDFRTFIKFRSRHLARFQALFVQVVGIARELGLVKMGHVSIDGTKMKANASKHKAMSYDRMKSDEKRLRKEIRSLTDRAKSTDEAEDKAYGEWDGESLPEELSRRRDRLQKIREARARLEARASDRAVSEREDRVKANEERVQRGEHPKRFRKDPDPTPGEKEQESFTDPSSRIMLDGATKGFIQAYNAQVAVDGTKQIIVACEVTNCASDAGQLLPMLDASIANIGEEPTYVTADAGYRSEKNFEALADRKIEAYVSCGREKTRDKTLAPRGRIPAATSLTDRMIRKLQTKQGKARYRRRKYTVEPPIGWVKSVLGFRQFSLRGLEKVQGEWALVTMALNLRRMVAPC